MRIQERNIGRDLFDKAIVTCQSESDTTTCILGNQKDVSKNCREPDENRCQSVAEGLDELVCLATRYVV